MNFNTFNLHPKLLSNIQTLGYETPTPIQEKSIPPILEGQDIMGLAQTGTGKTAAFLLPILQQLLDAETPSAKTVRALIIAPTRELAQQIDDSIKAFAKNTELRSVALYGGMKFGGQLKAIKQGVDIVVACPGRLLDHLQQRTVNLSHVKVLVLDEADQMFDMGFLPNIRKILKQLPRQRQTLLFSATMPGAIDALAQEILREPIAVKINRNTTPQAIQQTIFPVPAHRKSDFLIHLLHRTEARSVLVFTRTKHTAKKLSLLLEEWGFKAASLQGNLSQSKRQAAMNNFRDGKLKILVATDIASRGIDVTHISHVINYDMPGTVEAYIHRIGRTGRATQSGEAYTLISGNEHYDVRRIEKTLGVKLKQQQLEDFDYRGGSSSHSEAKPSDTHKPRLVHSKPKRPAHGKAQYAHDDESRPARGKPRFARDDESGSSRGDRPRYARDDRDRERSPHGKSRRTSDDESRPARGKPRFARDDRDRPGASRGGHKSRFARGDNQSEPSRRSKPRYANDDQSRPARGKSRFARDDQSRPARGKPRHASDDQPRSSRGKSRTPDDRARSPHDESRPWHKKRKSKPHGGAATTRPWAR